MKWYLVRIPINCILGGFVCSVHFKCEVPAHNSDVCVPGPHSSTFRANGDAGCGSEPLGSAADECPTAVGGSLNLCYLCMKRINYIHLRNHKCHCLPCRLLSQLCVFLPGGGAIPLTGPRPGLPHTACPGTGSDSPGAPLSCFIFASQT